MAEILGASSVLRKKLLPLIAALTACQQAPSNDAVPLVTENIENLDLAAADRGQHGPEIDVWSDPKATYTDEGSGELPNGNLWSLTRRDGPSGVSFSKREIDCAAGEFRYTQEGDAVESMSDVKGAEMAPLTEGSISTLVSDYVCRKHGRGGVSGT